MVAKDTDLIAQLRIAGHNCAGFSECSKILSGVEAKARHVPQAAGPTTLVLGPVGLGGVLYDQ